jgi:hypothetical protein
MTVSPTEPLGTSAWSQLRRMQQARPLRPYEELEVTPLDVGSSGAMAKLKAVVEKGWTRHGVDVGILSPPVNWTGHPRSVTFALQSWEPFSPMLAAFDQLGEPAWLRMPRQAADDWIKTFVDPLDPGSIADLLGRSKSDPGLAWYDMAVGCRLFRLGYILDVLLRDADESDDALRRYWHAIAIHMRLLAEDGFFRSHNNHGFYQALGQLAVARRFADWPGMREHHALAVARLDTLLSTHFFPSGVHREHSPSYHYMLLGTLGGARRAGLLQEHNLALLDRAEQALSWMIMPDGRIVPFGDSEATPLLRPPSATGDVRDPELAHLLTGGASGTVPAGGVRMYEDAGYAFIRLPSGSESGWSYLAQHAGFHSRTHKHADHLSIDWFDRGHHILAEPGRYAYAGKTNPSSLLAQEGFWYDDPRRIYVERTAAHNTVEVDGMDHPRVRVTPFGSGLIAAGVQDGIAFTESEVRLHATIRFRRIVLLDPGRWLLVVDWLADMAGGSHDYRQWFHLAPEWAAIRDGAGYVAETGGKQLHLRSLVPGCEHGPVLRGRVEPSYAGWRSERLNELTPSPSLSFQLGSRATATFATLLAFGDVELPAAGPKLSPTLTSARLSWTLDGVSETVALRRGSGVPLAVERTRG